MHHSTQFIENVADRLLRVLNRQSEDQELAARFADFQPDHFDLENVNRPFDVDGPCDSIQPTIKRTKPSASTQRNDPLYRLGLKLKKAALNGAE